MRKIPMMLLCSCVFAVVSCHSSIDISNQKPLTIKNTSKDSEQQANPIQYEISDAPQLTLIKNNFYKNQAGYLYQKTTAQTSSDKVTFKPYFNGMIPQDIDPYTFEQIADSWYAKDKNRIYLYRPVSGGMLISPIKQANSTSFNVINYNYAVDNNHFYHESEIIQNFIPQQTQQIENA